MVMSKETNSLFLEPLDDEGMNYFSWPPQAEIYLDAAGFGLYYPTDIQFKKKTYAHAAAKLKAFGTICKLIGKNHTFTTLKEFAAQHKTSKKSPFKLWKFLQHRFSGPGSNSNARLKVLYEEVKHVRGCQSPLIAKKAIIAKNEEIERPNGTVQTPIEQVESLLKAVSNFEHSTVAATTSKSPSNTRAITSTD
jgi:hypothetical protein